MKFSEKWLRTFVDPALDSGALADALTMSGLEVEERSPVAPAFEKVIVAAISGVEPHPDATRLTICKVDSGAESLQVVCGAANVRAGMRVALATAGARLPGVEIKAATVRGVESAGMLCSARELGISDDATGLMELPADAPLGADIRAFLELDDQVFTVKPTPNRGDCLSVLGVAREVAAISGSVLQRVAAASHVTLDEEVAIAVDAPQACPRYCARVVRGVNAGVPTPRWLVQRLERGGLRSISAIVDVTNYVMLELGQPLHAFDRARIDGCITVRYARPGETVHLLNDQRIDLTPDLLVIADERRPLALAGIMGGQDSAVSSSTTEIVLESAFFDPSVIAGKSRQLGFGSDSSYRFERGVDYSATRSALDRATELIVSICGGHCAQVCEVVGALPERKPIHMRLARARRLLGIELAQSHVDAVFTRLGFSFEPSAHDFLVTPPAHRFDLNIEEDMIEEVARIHGYERIPARQPVAAAAMLPVTDRQAGLRDLRRRLVSRDYQEVITYSFVDRQWEADFCANAAPVVVVNPIAAQMSVMRSSLVGSLVDCLKLNLSRQQDRVRIFETGRVFARDNAAYRQRSAIGGLAYGKLGRDQWGMSDRRADYYDVRADIEALLGPQRDLEFTPGHHPALHPGRTADIRAGDVTVGWLGELHPGLQQKYDLPFAPVTFEIYLDALKACPPAHYREFSRMPQVRRDIAVEVAEGVPAQAMLQALKTKAPETVLDVVLFDVYRGKGIDSDKKSVAFRMLLQDTQKTLTDAEIDAAQRHMVKVLQEEFQAKLRK